ncbi:cobalamin biosynthesis protein [Thioclava sp. BHET1]|nr:cobalamin biosynthesis protein [Thioclava sp. BHET1]
MTVTGNVAGIGFRSAAPLASLIALIEALEAPIAALATTQDKADQPQTRALARALGLPLLAITPERIAAQSTHTRSARVIARIGAGSLAEAAALAACGPGARLLIARRISPDRMASAALATGDET